MTDYAANHRRRLSAELNNSNQADFSFIEALLWAFGVTLLSAVSIWGIADIIQGLRHL